MQPGEGRLIDLLTGDGYHVEDLEGGIYNVRKDGEYLYTLTVTATP